MIDLPSLHYALLVRDSGSFRKAASVLGVTVSVVSRKVRALEDTIGVSLFQRQSQGVQPTSAGRRIFHQALIILTEVDALFRIAALSGSGAEGHLCVGIVASIAGGQARELLTDFLAGHPGVIMDLAEGTPGDHFNAVRALRMDVALVVGSQAAVGCNVEPLWSEQIFVALSENSHLALVGGLRWEQLGNERFIVSRASSGPEIHDIVMQHLTDLGRVPVVDRRPVQRSGLLGLVSLGLGITLVGTAEAAVSYPGVAFRPLEGETLPFSAVWVDNNDNPALRRFLSLARAQMRRLP